MRKKIIEFLYKCRPLRWLLPIFHVLSGKNRFKNKRNCSFDTGTSVLYKNRFNILRGNSSEIKIGCGTFLSNSVLTVKGSNNKILIGENGFINGIDLVVEGNGNTVIIGNNAFVLDDTRIYVVDGGLFKMGDSCMLSDRIEIRATDNHSIIDLNTNKRINFEKPIILHDHVWLGTGVTLLKGSEIADGCIVGAKSLVTGTFSEKNCIIAGNPAKVIKKNVDWKMERIKNDSQN